VVGVKSSASWTCFLFTFPNFVLEYILLISFGRNLRTKMFHGVNSSAVLLSNHFITLIFHPGRKKYCHKIYSWSKTKLFNVTYLDFLVPLNATLGLYICMVTEWKIAQKFYGITLSEKPFGRNRSNGHLDAFISGSDGAKSGDAWS
jgi:hypothetical protein